MSGSGGHKHRKRKRDRQRLQADRKARMNIARIKNQFEKRGQIWDPLNTPAQMAALTHAGRRLVARPEHQKV